ncbi:MAG: lytic transglycosylase domain-containing protein [Spirochaetaceae bacterium]|nr:lytic transglycosylase domain-containing protein [Spirochaetaceae bacterium]
MVLNYNYKVFILFFTFLLFPILLFFVKNEKIDERKYFDVPLEETIQDTLIDLCAAYEVDPVLILSVIKHESEFIANSINKNNRNGTIDYGLMQINNINHDKLKKELEITDFLNPEQNIHAGIYILSEYLKKYELHEALICYNMGERGFKELSAKGIKSTGYSRKITEIMQTIKYKNA